jgi:hypothetical protein
MTTEKFEGHHEYRSHWPERLLQARIGKLPAKSNSDYHSGGERGSVVMAWFELMLPVAFVAMMGLVVLYAMSRGSAHPSN